MMETQPSARWRVQESMRVLEEHDENVGGIR